ncbi:MAG: hypothetical protein ACP5HG_07540 [Anaerolineae bacterium]
MDPRLKRILIMVVVLVALAIPLMIMLEDFVRDAIVLPLAYQVWFVGVIIDALPQSWLLTVVLALILYLGLRSLQRDGTTSWRRQTQKSEAEGSVSAWRRRLQLVTKGSYSQQRFDHQLGQLLLRVVSYEQRLSMRETVRALEAGELDMPPELEAYLKDAMRPTRPTKSGLLARLKSAVLGRQSKESTLCEMAVKIEPALRYMETQLRMTQPEESEYE